MIYFVLYSTSKSKFKNAFTTNFFYFLKFTVALTSLLWFSQALHLKLKLAYHNTWTASTHVYQKIIQIRNFHIEIINI